MNLLVDMGVVVPRPPDEGAGRGVFVALEGIDGAGKTTAVREAGRLLRSREIPVVAFDKKRPPFVSAYVEGHLAAAESSGQGDACPSTIQPLDAADIMLSGVATTI